MAEENRLDVSVLESLRIKQKRSILSKNTNDQSPAFDHLKSLTRFPHLFFIECSSTEITVKLGLSPNLYKPSAVRKA